jgi:hypothetical protein
MRIRFCSLILYAIVITGMLAAPCLSQKLDIEADTRSYQGVVAPRHAAAVWIQTPGGELVNTVMVWSAQFHWCLMHWRTVTFILDTGTYDGVTSATRPGHDIPLAIAWDCKDTSGNLVPDGTYEFCLEMTESEYWWKHNDPNEVYLGRIACGEILIDSTSKIAYGDSSDTCIANLKATYSPTAGILVQKQQSIKSSFLSYQYNPISGRITFTLRTLLDQPSLLNIVDVKGKLVKVLEIDTRTREFHWDFRSGSSKKIVSGVYLFELRQLNTGKRIGSSQSITFLR